MIRLDDDLPQAVLLDGATAELAAAMAGCGGTWLHGAPDRMRLSGDGVLSGWRSMDDRTEAVPTKPNEGHGRAVPTATGIALQSLTGVNCGMVVPGIADRTDSFSMAVLYHPDPTDPARTLLTLNGEGDSRTAPYLFLSDAGDSLLVKDTAEGMNLEIPKTPQPAGLRCVIVTLSGTAIAMQDGAGPVHMREGVPAALPSPTALFIAARSHRSGLQKMLGAALIEDVMFWPGLCLLTPRTPQDHAMRMLLARYHLWRR